MFGYLTAQKNQFDEPSFQRYRALYCGLCRTLGEEYGFTGRMTLQYDLTFLAGLLLALENQEERTEQFRCPAHFFHPCDRTTAAFTAYCAHLNILLAYYKLEDDWLDDRQLSAGAGKNLLESAKKKAEALLPEYAAVIRRELSLLHEMESAGETSADLPADSFGRLMAKLFVPPELHTCREQMEKLGFALGRLLYMMDAYIDLRGDLKHGRYNPLSFYTHVDRTMLEALAGEASAIYETLPIQQDKPMLDTILYQGIWNRCYAMQAQRKKKEEGRSAGS